MSEEKYKELAKCLNKEQDGVPRARRILLNLNKIESILETGVTIKYLVEKLNENEFIIKTTYFYEELGLARKKLKKQGVTARQHLSDTQQHKSINPVSNNDINANNEKGTAQEKQKNEPENERPKSIKQIKAEAEAEFKKIQSKPHISASLQRAIDKQDKQRN